jgi:hypothetical protein
MSNATLEALRKISRTLHDAGWAEPAPAPAPLTDERLEQLRRVSHRVLGPDDLTILQLLVGDRRPLSELARAMNRDPDELGTLVSKAIRDLNTFTTEAASALTDREDTPASSHS